MYKEGNPQNYWQKKTLPGNQALKINQSIDL